MRVGRGVLGLLRTAIGAAIFLAGSAGPVAAQVRGVVVDAAERPVAGAIVELWVGQRRTAAAESDPQGAFTLAPAGAHGPATLSVRRIGLRTRTFDLASADTTLRIQMEAQPVTLAPVTVASPLQRVCPNREDPRARVLWERMRSRYWQETLDTVLVFGLVEFRTGTGERTETEGLRTEVGWTQGAVSASASRYLPRTGYALRVATSAGERSGQWQYRSLDDGMKQDFTQAYFGATHTLSIEHSAAGRTVLGFCPRERLGQYGQIIGTLVIGPDTTLIEARWSFRTQNPSEDAGGRAVYNPPDPRIGSVLLANESSFWRKTTRGDYYVENRTYTGWRVWNGATTVRGNE